MKNILVTGSDGQLGRELRQVFEDLSPEICWNWNVIHTDIGELDITSKKMVSDFISDNDIAMIVNCAAYTAVDKAEQERDACMEINGKAPGYLAGAAAKRGALLIHISSDYIFEGSAATPRSEEAKPCPQSVYGISKLAGEQSVISGNSDYIILRSSWLYSRYGHNFVSSILKLSAEMDSLDVVFDQTGSPTNGTDLAALIAKIVAKRLNGDHKLQNIKEIYNYSNEGVCSWYDFATEIVDISGNKCRINPITSDKYPTKAKRPSYSVLDKTKIKAHYAIDIPHWRMSLCRTMKQILQSQSRSTG